MTRREQLEKLREEMLTKHDVNIESVRFDEITVSLRMSRRAKEMIK